jgi:hypothetical protein
MLLTRVFRLVDIDPIQVKIALRGVISHQNELENMAAI